MSRSVGPGKRRGEVVVMEGPDGGVYAKTLKGGRLKVRAYRHDGDKIREAELAVQAVKVFDAVYRNMTGSGTTLTGMQILDDHPIPDDDRR